MTTEKNKAGIVSQIFIAVIIALLVGGTSPWWWKEFFGNGEQGSGHTQEPQSSVDDESRESPKIFTEEWILVGEDSFQGVESKWPIGTIKISTKPVGSARQVSGKYRVEFETNEGLHRAFDSPFGASLDLRMGLDVKMMQANSSYIAAGLNFGYSKGIDYQFLIRADGNWGVFRGGAKDNPLNEKPIIAWTKSGVDVQDWNRLEVTIVNQKAVLSLNSEVVGEFFGTDYSGGLVGISVASEDNSSATIDFDNFEYYRKK